MKFRDLSNVAATSAVIQFATSSYNLTLLGVYVVTINYSWAENSTAKNTIKITLIDPCLVAVVPPASLASSSSYMGDLDTKVNVAPSIIADYQSICVYSISNIVTKSSLPDTSLQVVMFNQMTNYSYSNIGNASITLHSSSYNPTYAGIYFVSV